MTQSPHPLHGGNQLKIGIFCTNGQGAAQTLVPEVTPVSWDFSLRTAIAADEAGYEAVVPFSRWKGYPAGRPDHYSGRVFDPFTFAAGIAQATKQISVFATSHALTMHPIVVAKQGATIDAISNGRFALNVVAGWNKPELDMFGVPMPEHAGRYSQLGEWVTILRKLWSETDEFDYDGEFYTIRGGSSEPKPVQASTPPIMNAGGSATGKRFAAEHADVCFVVLQSQDEKDVREQVEQYKAMARTEFGREIQVWVHSFVVQRDTVREAQDYLHRYAVEYEDTESVDACLATAGANSQTMPEDAWRKLRQRFAAGMGGVPLIGTDETIAADLMKLSACGIDGVLLTWVDYDEGIQAFTTSVLPHLESAGLRKPVAG
jgi:dimethylsulfone monooxygenase